MTGWLVGGLFLILGLVFFLFGMVNNNRAKKALTWPTTTGTVLTSGVTSHTSTSNGIRNTTYEPEVSYQYSLMGQVYNGKRIRFGANRMKQDEAYEVAGRYPVGSQVNVHYNPDKVTESALETVAQGSTVFIVLGAIMMVFGVIAFFIF